MCKQFTKVFKCAVTYVNDFCYNYLRWIHTIVYKRSDIVIKPKVESCLGNVVCYTDLHAVKICDILMEIRLAMQFERLRLMLGVCMQVHTSKVFKEHLYALFSIDLNFHNNENL